MTTTTRGDQVMVRLMSRWHGTDVQVIDEHGPARQQPVSPTEREAADELVREMRSSALTELRRLAGPNSGARAREIMAEVARYDRWLGEER